MNSEQIVALVAFTLIFVVVPVIAYRFRHKRHQEWDTYTHKDA